MTNPICSVKRKLDSAIQQLCNVSWMFVKDPLRDFTRNRKLPFRTVISILLSMEGRSLNSELLSFFGCLSNIPSASAFIQQRAKISKEAFSSLFDLFVRLTDNNITYKGYRLLAADGSDIQIPTDKNDVDSYFPGSIDQAPYNLLHLNAVYDLLQHTYVDAYVYGKRSLDERASLCSMVDRSPISNALVIADRGFEAYNLLAHIQEKNWKFLIRVKDTHSSGIAASLDLPPHGEFDRFFSLALTKRQTNDVKNLLLDKNSYKFLPACVRFDFLPSINHRHDPPSFYNLRFRVVRFKLSDDSFETVITNLDEDDFPPAELKRLYNLRWGIESSFRALKYTLGLLFFHSKKVEYIFQEIFARLIMYNFTELVASSVMIQHASKKYSYNVNFSVAVHVCRLFFLGNAAPPDVDAILRRYISPIRPGRCFPRNLTPKHTISFTYRLA